MIGVKFNGRLGNQLFQYVYLMYLKEKQQDDFIFFTNPRNSYIAKYFNLGSYFTYALRSRLYASFVRKALRRKHYNSLELYNIFSPKARIIQDNTIVSGYFQSDWYIQQLAYQPKIKVKGKYVKQFKALYGDIFGNNKTVAVHIRRTDYLDFCSRDVSIPMSFFKHQLARIEDIDQYKVLFVSDDIDFVKAEIPQRSNFIYCSNSEIIDFQIIQNADIAIISNSTFSWWASYLSPKQNLVIAPKNWLGYKIGAEYPRGIMTNRFMWEQ